MEFRIRAYLLFIVLFCSFPSAVFPGNDDARRVSLPGWEDPANVSSQVLSLGFGQGNKGGWGHYSPNERAFFNEVLPAVFKRTLVIDSITGDRGLKWIFTGPREGFYIELNGNKLLFYRKYYDSFGYNHQKEELPSYPQFEKRILSYKL